MVHRMRLRSGRRDALLALLVACGALAVAPAAALAGAGLSATPLFTNNTQTVGNVNQTGTLTVQNANNGPDISATICRADDTPVSTPAGACVGAEGLVMTPSCGAQFPNFACRPGPPSAPPSGVDPDVFSINPTAVGTGGVCVGTNFLVTRRNPTSSASTASTRPGRRTSSCPTRVTRASSASRSTC